MPLNRKLEAYATDRKLEAYATGCRRPRLP